jgi:hypothetical protein
MLVVLIAIAIFVGIIAYKMAPEYVWAVVWILIGIAAVNWLGPIVLYLVVAAFTDENVRAALFGGGFLLGLLILGVAPIRHLCETFEMICGHTGSHAVLL